MPEEVIKIDGAYLEGGGQILRTAAALSAITERPCHIFNIRKGRPAPGLKTQHLLGLRALAELCNGKLEGDALGSTEIKFHPGKINRERLSVNIDTAGSITLVLQGLLLPALFTPKPVEILFKGGATDTFFSPTLDYFQYVFLKILEKMGVRVEIDIEKRGFFPRGGAEIKVKVFPATLKPLKLKERGEFKKIKIFSGASESLKDKRVAERQVAGVKEVIGKLNLRLEEDIQYHNTDCPGSYICLVAEFENTVIGSDNLGKLGKSAEEVGQEAARELLKEQRSGTPLDKHMADQILPYIALANKKSRVAVSEITNHCKTNIWVIEKFLDGQFNINDENNIITWAKAE